MTAIRIENHDTTQYNRLTSRASSPVHEKLVKVTCNLCDTNFSSFLTQVLIKIYLFFSSPMSQSLPFLPLETNNQTNEKITHETKRPLNFQKCHHNNIRQDL